MEPCFANHDDPSTKVGKVVHCDHIFYDETAVARLREPYLNARVIPSMACTVPHIYGVQCIQRRFIIFGKFYLATNN
jgi:hypothetical protein